MDLADLSDDELHLLSRQSAGSAGYAAFAVCCSISAQLMHSTHTNVLPSLQAQGQHEGSQGHHQQGE